MVKIKKNLSDTDMLANWQEEVTFENTAYAEQLLTKTVPKAKDPYSTFITPELEEKLGKALLELKVELYKEGLVDYELKVSCRNKEVVLTPVPRKKKKE